MEEEKDCIHWWKLSPPDLDHTPAVCRNCGAQRDYGGVSSKEPSQWERLGGRKPAPHLGIWRNYKSKKAKK